MFRQLIFELQSLWKHETKLLNNNKLIINNLTILEHPAKFIKNLLHKK